VIGFFDSGSGGLTILQGCRKAMPDVSFVYLGDHANAPYGHRDNQAIVDLTKAGVDALFREGCTLVVLACNTAAAVALRTLQQNWLQEAWPGRNILGVLVPMVEAVSGVPWADKQPSQQSVDDVRTILLFATTKTVESGAYAEELAKRAPNLTLIQKACPGLVDAIEGGAGTLPLYGLVKGYVDEVYAALEGRKVDAAVLGCTHFPMIEPLFRQALGADIPLYSQQDMVAEALVRYIAAHPNYEIKKAGTIRLFSTSAQKDITGWDKAQLSEQVTFEQMAL
jgi:glutamate racemase